MPTKTCALVERLQTIADPRRQGENLKHPLVDVIIVGFCGVLAGCEDARRVYDRTVAENVAFLNRLALSLLRGDTSKSSLKVKRKRAGWQIPYLAQLLGFPSP
jgi:hypothetical protein